MIIVWTNWSMLPHVIRIYLTCYSVLTSHPYLITDVEVIPGISDHEAILYRLNPSSKLPMDEIEHPVFLYHKGDIRRWPNQIAMSTFQMKFLTSDPYSNSVEDNWQIFKKAINNAMLAHIPQRLSTISLGLLALLKSK